MTATPNAIVTADPDGNVIGWHGHATDWFGYQPARIVGQSVELLIPEQCRDDHRKELQRAMAGGERHLEGAATHLPVLHADGQTSIHPARFNHLNEAHGNLVAAAAVFGPATTDGGMTGR